MTSLWRHKVKSKTIENLAEIAKSIIRKYSKLSHITRFWRLTRISPLFLLPLGVEIHDVAVTSFYQWDVISRLVTIDFWIPREISKTLPKIWPWTNSQLNFPSFKKRMKEKACIVQIIFKNVNRLRHFNEFFISTELRHSEKKHSNISHIYCYNITSHHGND